MNHAILLSGGAGLRTGREIPKQYLRFGEYMMITRALAALLDAPQIDRVVIVADVAWREKIDKDAAARGLPMEKLCGYADPGANRQLSIWNGLQLIAQEQGQRYGSSRQQRGLDTVFIHDAARPFLMRSLIDDCYAALPGHDGVLPVLPMKDTVYESRDGKTVGKLLTRDHIFAGQAPELFLLDRYIEANRVLLPDDILAVNGSTEPAVMAGMDIAMIRGDERNFKVTTAEDLARYCELMETEGAQTV